MIKLIAISDTHGAYYQLGDLPKGDILVHAGDWTYHSSHLDTISFLKWIQTQPHKHKIFIAGNHETWVEKNPEVFAQLKNEYAPDCIYLNDSGVEVEGLKIWGSPVTPYFLDWAFNRERGPDIQAHWDKIPDDTNVLITHGPIVGILDYVIEYGHKIRHVGCQNLDQTIRTRLKALRAHIFGHVHAPGGKKEVWDNVVYVNAAVVNEDYQLANEPQIIGL